MDEEMTGAETLFLREEVTRMEKELGRPLGKQEIEFIKMNLGLIPATWGIESTRNSLEHSLNAAKKLRRKKSQRKYQKPLNALKKATAIGINEREGD